MKVQIVFAHGMSKSPHAPFGNQNKLPWKHNKEDLARFKAVTMNSVLVMGSKTFESLPGKLADRPHVVLSSSDTATAKNGQKADVYCKCDSFQDLIKNIENVYLIEGFDKISVIGGPSVIESALPFADHIYKTTIVDEIEAYDVTIDLTKIFWYFPHNGESEIVECQNGSTIFIEKLTKGDL
ncbi:dihydrofolate reductase [Vibrio phage phi-ST2]|uniref:dihydrofolate reductase n=2 Tax=Schizotequatrovirus valkk3 TaxID=1914021 RepID=A0A126HGE7_9CAUD|nr:dihydrofolate reductase [Vibrio phage ValKK3]ALP47088.1 dihydrofolate reductase [Vibrio phage phi-Grn1]ALP47469.1 dihydrofolate reductase [Vibrio phage phi-ST2]QBX06083.1 dihydrofolate reductase [Vibrio phage Va3]QNJ54709.1 dihydrofolate reductase [Vibrio phage vB_ValM_R10Z]QNJ55095.1 dihydrofolate reductase [Vibrio phage vB_ValM_R11Z]